MSFLTKSLANRSLFSSSSPQKCKRLLQTLNPTSRFASTAVSKPRKSKIPKPEEPSLSYVLTNPRIETDEVEKVSSWPRPSEIPYQAKVANFINLVGFVQTPVQFDASLDWKYCASTVVAHENCDDSSVLMIPVVFGGDLAHVVACHVKENDCVYVSGKFSMDPLPIKFIEEYQSCFHIVAENINFVQGLKRNVLKRSVKPVYPKNLNFSLDGNDKKHSDSLSGLEYADSVNSGGSKSEEGLTRGDDWRDLVKNPKQWWDCRKAKLDGVVKPRHPDFKKKEDGNTSLWLENAPRWVFDGLEGLEFDIHAPKSKGVGKEVDSWKDLLENPDNWWDNRTTKLNQKAPDFKHKNTGIGLWVDSSPDWVLSQLPPLRDQTAASSHK
ncbi:unnamed protein product [Withania somnifera]